MEPSLPWYQSAIIRQQIVQLLVAGAALFGVATDVDFTPLVEGLFGGVAALVAIWTIVTRLFKPAPNMTATAAHKEAQLKADGDFPPEPKAPTVVKKNAGFASQSFLVCLLLAGCMAAASLAGCAAMSAVKEAQTLEQRAAALIGDFGIFQSAALNIGEDPTVPTEVRRRVLDASIAAKPAVDQLDGLLRSYRAVSGDLARGATSEAKVKIAAERLSAWILEVAPKIASLRSTIEGARP